MNNAQQIKSDTLTILICYHSHKHLNVKDRALKLARICKLVQSRTKDNLLFKACGNIIRFANGKQYLKAINLTAKTDSNYAAMYKV